MTRPFRLAALAAALLIVLTTESCDRTAQPGKVVLFAIDGATWKVIGPAIERGELPAFARLLEEGASTKRFETMESTQSPVVWTTVVTGRKPEHHGIEDFVEKLRNRRKIPVSSASRRAARATTSCR